MGKIITMAIGIYVGWQLCANRDEIARRLEEYQGVADSEEPVLEASQDEVVAATRHGYDNGYNDGYAAAEKAIAKSTPSDEEVVARQEELSLAMQESYENGIKIGIEQGRAKAVVQLENDKEWIDRMFRRHFPERAAQFVAGGTPKPGV